MPFWFALVYLRPQPEDALSLLAIMGLGVGGRYWRVFLRQIVWQAQNCADHQPGKSWEGAIGGALCVAVYMTIVWKPVGWLLKPAG